MTIDDLGGNVSACASHTMPDIEFVFSNHLENLIYIPIYKASKEIGSFAHIPYGIVYTVVQEGNFLLLMEFILLKFVIQLLQWRYPYHPNCYLWFEKVNCDDW